MDKANEDESTTIQKVPLTSKSLVEKFQQLQFEPNQSNCNKRNQSF